MLGEDDVRGALGGMPTGRGDGGIEGAKQTTDTTLTFLVCPTIKTVSLGAICGRLITLQNMFLQQGKVGTVFLRYSAIFT